MNNSCFTVSQLLFIIKDALSLDGRLQRVKVSGELSNFTLQKSGHAYFSLKDDKAKINCVMFRSYFDGVKFKLQDGMAVFLEGWLNVYEASGQLQINVFALQQAGLGELYLLLEKLKIQLEKEGLFDLRYKKKIPPYPEKIAVVTAKDSAAAADIRSNLARRWPLCRYSIFVATMQGRSAAPEIIEQLQQIDQGDYDLVIIGRGGGSFEDLYCFNEESLVRAVFALKTPVVTGIGHQSDSTLVDLVADLAAPTPTAAVELSTPALTEEKARLQTFRSQLQNALINSYESQELLFTVIQHRLFNYKNVLLHTFSGFRLLQMAFQQKLEGFSADTRLKLQDYSYQLKAGITLIYQDKLMKTEQLSQLLNAYNPRQILKRGYAIITKDATVVSSLKQLRTGECLQVQLSDGRFSSLVKDIDDGKEIC